MSKPPLYLEVAVPTPLRRSFYYTPPDGTPVGETAPGTRVSVPFARRNVTGVILGTRSEADIDPSRIKSAHALLDKSPILDPIIMKLCTWAAGYYHHPIGEVIATAMPVLLRQGELVDKPEPVLCTTTHEMPELSRAPRQAAAMQALLKAPGGLSKPELRQHDINSSTIRALIQKGLLAWQTRETGSAPLFDTSNIRLEQVDFELDAEQVNAITCIKSAGPRPCLLFGVTGSGKTEIYLQLIENVLQSGKQALVLVPEIGLTPQTVARFTHRFNVPVVALHSGLNDRERLDGWRAARDGSAGIIIGTRSAIFTPLRQPGLIVVDEEHDASFKQHDGFRYNARDLAVMRGQLEKVPVILGTATPSLETWHNAKTGKYQLEILTSRPGAAEPASYKVIDIRNQPLTEGFSPALIDAMTQHLGQGNQVLVFLNRRGFSPVLLCRECGWIAHCRRCDSRMTVHVNQNNLICHHCLSQMRLTRQCPECSGSDLVPLGAGTQRIESAMHQLFPAYPVLRIDRDSTRRKTAMNEFREIIASGNPAILVGTQLLAKGHHFPDVTLVAIIDMDSGFYSADYKATERMAQLVLQVGGRAGRAQKPGVVAIQTHFPNQSVFRTLIENGYASFANNLLEERKEFELPPYHYQALLRSEATARNPPMEFLEAILEGAPGNPSVTMLGPIPAPMERRAGRFRAQLLLTSTSRGSLQRHIDACIEVAERSPLARKVRWSIDVDPVDLF